MKLNNFNLNTYICILLVTAGRMPFCESKRNSNECESRRRYTLAGFLKARTPALFEWWFKICEVALCMCIALDTALRYLSHSVFVDTTWKKALILRAAHISTRSKVRSWIFGHQPGASQMRSVLFLTSKLIVTTCYVSVR